MRIRFGFLLLLLLIVVSCETNTTSYQIVNNKDFIVTEKDSLIDGSMYGIVVFVYYGDDIARQDNIKAIAPEGGVSDMFEVPDDYDRIRVTFTDAPIESVYGSLAEGARKFVARYDYLEYRKNNRIIINDSTIFRYIYEF